MLKPHAEIPLRALKARLGAKASKNAAHGNPKRRTRGTQTPHAGISNAARGDLKRRTRGLPTPHAAFANTLHADVRLRLYSQRL